MISERASTRSVFGRVALCSILLAAAAGSLAAQLTTGTILGTVKDPSAAVLPGVTVTVTNMETGIARTSLTGSRGEFQIPGLAVGSYEVQVTTAGFQTEIRKGITLNVGREAVVDFTLQVGAVAEQVTVTGEAPLIEITSATVGGVVDSKQMRDIPLNSRSFLELIPLQANATITEMGEQSASKGYGKKLSIAGTRYNTSLFLLDGASMNDVSNTAGSAAGTLAGIETVREFKVITNAYDSEYGRHTGGVVSAVTKSGTNQFHGVVFEFLRNDNLDASKWETNAFGGVKPAFRRNQFGGALGGPIQRDRTFFFGSYEGLREGLGRTQVYDVPGFSMRNGLLPAGGGTLQNIGVAPAVRPFLLAFPEPNVPCATNCLGQGYPFDRNNGAGQFSKAINQTTVQNYFTARIDHRFSDSDSVFGRFTSDRAERLTPDLTTEEVLRSPNRFVTLEEAHIISPALLSRSHFSFSRTNLWIFDGELSGFKSPIFSFDGSDVPGRISVTNLSAWGGSSTNPKVNLQNLFQLKEDFNYTVGRQSLKFGVEFDRAQFNQRSDFHSGGTFTFASLGEFMRNDVSQANFVKPGSDNIRGWRQNVTGLYIQDDIKVKPEFTANLGVRYEFVSTPHEVNMKVANIWDLREEHLYKATPDTTDLGDPYLTNPSLKNFAPRVGFAWDPFGGGKLSVRGGFGLFFEQLTNYESIASGGVRAAPYYSTADLFRQDFQRLGLTIDFPNTYVSQRSLLASGAGGKPQIDGFIHYASQPYVMKWGLDIEKQIAPSTTLETGYSATRGIHLVRGNLQLNVTPSEIRNGRRFILVQQELPNPFFNRIRWRITDGMSDYHSFRLTVNKRFSRGFQFQSAYTVSKSTDDSSTWTGSSDFGAADRNGYRTNKDHGLSGFDVRQSWTSNFIVDLPGRNLKGAAGKALGGWNVSGILRFNSGNPFTLTAQNPQARVGTTTFAPQFVDGAALDLVPGADQGQVYTQNPNKYYNTSNYALPACWTNPAGCNPVGYFQGNVGKNHIISPGVANVDFTLMKDTAMPWMGESGSLQFRAEFFNLLNRANFGLPGVSVYDRSGRLQPSAGQIIDTRTSARQIQFALRVLF